MSWRWQQQQNKIIKVLNSKYQFQTPRTRRVISHDNEPKSGFCTHNKNPGKNPYHYYIVKHHLSELLLVHD